MTQITRVRAHLEAGKTITPVIAMAVYGISRLSSCIEDLRNLGVDIDCVTKYDETGKQYGEYRLRRPIEMNTKVQVRRGFGMGLPHWVRRHRNATVVGIHQDTALVRFICGKNMSDEWLNHKELIRAD